jgi:hypothetical protein
MVALRLSKAGYGRPDEVLKMRTDLVMAAVHYEIFLKEYERAFWEMNKK